MRQNDIEKLAHYLTSLVEQKFFGSVVVTFQNGKVDTIKTEKIQRLDGLESTKDKRLVCASKGNH